MKKKSQTDWKFLASSDDNQIDVSDIPNLDTSFWERATIRMPERKDRVTIRLDHDIVTWFKNMGAGYQTRMNDVLRSYINSHSH